MRLRVKPEGLDLQPPNGLCNRGEASLPRVNGLSGPVLVGCRDLGRRYVFALGKSFPLLTETFVPGLAVEALLEKCIVGEAIHITIEVSG